MSKQYFLSNLVKIILDRKIFHLKIGEEKFQEVADILRILIQDIEASGN